MFSCEYCAIRKSAYLEKHLRTAAPNYGHLFAGKNHMQRCFDTPEPKFHKKLTCVMLGHSPQTIFHRKIIYNFFRIYLGRSSRPEVFCKKVFSEISQNSQENTCARVHFLIKFQASAKNEILVQVFFSEISNNTFFTELLWWLLLSGPTFMKKIIYTMLCRPWWTNIG